MDAGTVEEIKRLDCRSLWNSRVHDLGGDCALLLDKLDVISDAIKIDKA